MLDQEVKLAYQKITPSPELEQRILQMRSPARPKNARVLVMRRVAALAACAVFLLGTMTVIHGRTDMDILLPDGTELSSREMSVEPQYYGAAVARAADPAVPYALADEPAEIAIPLQFSAARKLELTTAVGTLMVSHTDDNTEEYVNEGQSATVYNGKADVYWILPISDEDGVYDLSVNQTYTVRVTYDAEQNEYTISRIHGNP